jgi:tetratricopeptide (TPR) repeat protein
MRWTALWLGLFLGCGVWAAEPLIEGVSKELQACLQSPDDQISLTQGALLICREEYPAVDVARQTAAINALGDQLFKALTQAGTVTEKLDTLRVFVFEQQKFDVPKTDQIADFMLSDVLKNKRGNCLGLSVLCLALVEKSGLKLHGVPVPSRFSGAGHLLVRFDNGATRINFDPAERGATHPDEHYQKVFNLRPEDLKNGIILGNAGKKDVLCILLVNLGGARVEAGRAAAALPLLELAVKTKPAYAPAWNNLGAAKLRLSRFDDARAAYQKALALQSGMVGARLGLAEIAFRSGNAADAEKGIQAVLAEEPENTEARNLLANAHLSRNEWQQAAAVLREVVKFASKDARAYCNLAKALHLGGDLAEAEHAYRQALEVDEECADAYYGLGCELRALGRADDADTAFANALKLNPGHVPTLLNDAQLALLAQKFDIAERGFQKALKADAQNADALGGLVKALVGQKKSADAMRVLADANKTLSSHPAIAILNADLKMSQGEHAAAAALLEKSLPGASENEKTPLLQRLGVCYGKQKLHRKALDVAELLLKKNERDGPALRLAAAANEGLQNRDKAIVYCKKVLELYPDDPVATKAMQRLGGK